MAAANSTTTGQAAPKTPTPLALENALEALTTAGDMCAAVRSALRSIGATRAPEEVSGCAEIVSVIGQRIGNAVVALGRGGEA
jgi:hypothetical protein